MTRLQVVEWSAWDRFLIRHVAPDAVRLPVEPGAPLGNLGDVAAPALLHVNLSRPGSVFPDMDRWLQRFAAAGCRVLNGYCASIDKRAVQDACRAAGLPVVRAARDGDAHEQLIVKTRANHRGLFERDLPAGLAGELCAPLWPYPERVHRLRRADVPDALWRDPAVVVERYVDNRDGRFQRAYVVGDWIALATSWSPVLVKEMDHHLPVAIEMAAGAATRALYMRDAATVAARLARAMRVDFGAIDLALDDAGVAHPIDVNLTPWWGGEILSPDLIDAIGAALVSLTQTGSRYASDPA